MHQQANDDWFTCPVCGGEVPANALACPHCGADDETGWSPDTEYDGLDLPIDDEWPVNERPARRRKAISLAMGILMIALILLLVVMR
ncbi:MAG: zinc ribbon domain-containing protein [Planctomycetota bacterium]